MLRPNKLPRGNKRCLPHRLKAEIILRQNGRCADCGTRLIMGFFIFDLRPVPVLDETERLAAICWTCDQRKTAFHAPR
jgi:hypothetical protein